MVSCKSPSVTLRFVFFTCTGFTMTTGTASMGEALWLCCMFQEFFVVAPSDNNGSRSNNITCEFQSWPKGYGRPRFSNICVSLPLGSKSPVFVRTLSPLVMRNTDNGDPRKIINQRIRYSSAVTNREKNLAQNLRKTIP